MNHVSNFALECVKAGISFNGRDEDKMLALRFKMTNHVNPMNRKERKDIYEMITRNIKGGMDINEFLLS